MKIAIIGAGMAVAPYLASLRELASRVDVGWMVGQSMARVQGAAQQLAGAVASTNLDDVLGDASVVTAFVLTPPNTHLAIVERLAAAGKHVLLEKPLEVDAAHAAKVVEVCRERGVRLGAMLQHRMRPASLAMRSLVAGGSLGEMTCASVDMR